MYFEYLNLSDAFPQLIVLEDVHCPATKQDICESKTTAGALIILTTLPPLLG